MEMATNKSEVEDVLKDDSVVVPQDELEKDDNVNNKAFGSNVVSANVIRCEYHVRMSYDFSVTVNTLGEKCIDETACMSNRNSLINDKPILMSGRTVTNGHSEHARVAHVCRKIRHKKDVIQEESFTAVEIDGRIYGFCTTKYINHSNEYPLIMTVLSEHRSLDEVVGGDMAMCWYGWSDQYFNVREINASDNFDLITMNAINTMVRECGVDPRYPLAAQAICRMFMADREYLRDENYVV